jgi:hypothetical protein
VSYPEEVFTDGPLAWWKFDEAAGATTAVDAAGTRNGTYLTGATPGSTPQTSSSVASVLIGSGNVQVPSDAQVTAIKTVEAWYRPTVAPSGSPAIFAHDWASGYVLPLVLGFNVGNTSGNFPGVGYYNGSGTWYVCNSTATLTLNTLYYLVGVYDGTTLRIYVNGAQTNSNVINQTRGTNTRPTANLGKRWDTADYTQGYIDDVAIYSGVLSATRIQAHYNAGVAAPTRRWKPRSRVTAVARAATR